MNTVAYAQPIQGGVPESVRRGAFNFAEANAMASADPRYNLKSLDRPGMSRGRGQMYQAGIAAARNMAEGMDAANQQALDLGAYNANLALQANTAREQNAQALGGLQAQNAYADQMAALQRQQMITGLLGGLLR